MLGVLKKRWKTNKRPILDLRTEDEDKDEPLLVSPPRFIKISDGKICLGPPLPNDNTKEKEVVEDRIAELEEALLRLQQKVNDSQCGSPTLEKDLKDQLENMNRAMKTKDRKTMQAFRDHKTLQARFTRQEAILQIMQQENKSLQQRVKQYEHCLDDVMRKVVDAIVAEDNLRLEVAMLKSRVRDLEAQNAALSTSPAKGKDEGYCTMSSGQPQPSNGHLEDLPEEPEQWLLPAEPCSIEMEDWSMSQEEEEGDEVGINEQEHDWIWNSGELLASSMIESQSEGITQLLQDTIVYSEDEEITCKNFTKDFYKLVNIIPSGSTRSLYSHIEATTDDENEEDDESSLESGKLTSTIAGPSPTPSEAGLALVTSCSSSESEEHQIKLNDHSSTICMNEQQLEPSDIMKNIQRKDIESSIGLKSTSVLTTPPTTPTLWKKSSGWMRVPPTSLKKVEPSKLPTPSTPSRIPAAKQLSPLRKSRIPPPLPIRRSYAS